MIRGASNGTNISVLSLLQYPIPSGDTSAATLITQTQATTVLLRHRVFAVLGPSMNALTVLCQLTSIILMGNLIAQSTAIGAAFAKATRTLVERMKQLLHSRICRVSKVSSVVGLGVTARDDDVGGRSSITKMALVKHQQLRRVRIRTRFISATLKIFLVTHFLGSITGMPFILYGLLRLTTYGVKTYDVRAVYWTGIMSYNYLSVSSIPVLFLTLDRCMALNGQKRCAERFVSAASALCTAVVYAGSATMFFLELPLQTDRVRHCVPFTCILLRFHAQPQIVVKSVLSALNLTLSAYFFTLLRSKRHLTGGGGEKSGANDQRKSVITTRRSAASNTANNVAAATVFIEFITSTLPNYISIGINLLTGQPSGNFLVPITTTSCALEAAFCSILYTVIFIRRPLPNRNGRNAAVGKAQGTVVAAAVVPNITVNAASNSSDEHRFTGGAIGSQHRKASTAKIRRPFSAIQLQMAPSSSNHQTNLSGVIRRK